MKYFNTGVKLSLLSLASIFITQACKSSKGMEEKVEITASKVPSVKSLLWKIEGNGLTTPSYLYGTIHMINTEDYFLPDGTLSAIDQSKEVMFELDMNEMTDMTKLMPMMQKAFMKDDLSLKDLVTATEYEVIKDFFADKGLPIFFLEKIKPMFLTVFTTADFNPNDLKTGGAKSYEFEFTEIANNAKKPISGLETIEYQISIFDEIPYEDQAQMLLEAIKTADAGDDTFKEMVAVYKSQDIDALYKMIQGDENMADHEDALLTTRNKNWIPVMQKKMAEMPVFFAVGAGHLGGPNGVISLLRNEGYKVTAYNG